MYSRIYPWLGCTLAVIAACGTSGAASGQVDRLPAAAGEAYAASASAQPTGGTLNYRRYPGEIRAAGTGDSQTPGATGQCPASSSCACRCDLVRQSGEYRSDPRRCRTADGAISTASRRRRGGQRPERQGQLQRRHVPLAGDAQQGLHHAPGRLDAMGQRLVEPVAGPDEPLRAHRPGTCPGRGRRALPQAASASCRTANTSAASAPSRKAPSGKPASTGSFWPWKTISSARVGLDEFWVGETHIPVIGTDPRRTRQRPGWAWKAI